MRVLECASRRGAMSPATRWRARSQGSGVKSSRHRPCTLISPDMLTPALTSRRFSALKMDGKPLYEYARKGIPLPRPIEKRQVTVHSLELIEWKGTAHGFRWPEKKFTREEQEAMEKALSSVEKEVSVKDEPDVATPDTVPTGGQDEDAGEQPTATAFVLSMKVSGGTYVRSVVHELGHALGSAAHVVTLTRSRQGRFALEPSEDGDHACVPWEVFQKALADEGESDEDGRKEWEREVLEKLEII